MKEGRLYFWLSFILILIADQLSKYLILKNFKEGQSLPVIKNIFHITFVRNSGLAFGLFKGTSQSVFIGSTVFLIAIIITYFLYIKPGGFFINVAMGLIFAGAIGNLIDRVSMGKVIDFFDFRIWPVFNIADTAVVVGIISAILVYTFIYEEIPNKSTGKQQESKNR